MPIFMMTLRLNFDRVAAVAAVMVYVAALLYTYGEIVAPFSFRLGLGERAIPTSYLLISLLLAIAPSLWMPLKVERPSCLLFYVQYFIVYIPSCFILYQTTLPVLRPGQAFSIIITMFAGLTIIQAGYKLPLFSIHRPRINPKAYAYAAMAFGLGAMIYVIFLFGSNFQLTGFETIYQVRSELAKHIDNLEGATGQYALMWLTGVFFPLVIAIGLFTSHRWLIALGGIGYIMVYGIAGNKLSILAVPIIVFVYLWARYARRAAIPAFTSGLSALLLSPIAIGAIGLHLVKYWYVGVVNQRIFGIPALMVAQFHDFFSVHPYTFFSHIRGLSRLSPYPYDMDLPRTVGLYYYNQLVGANTNFWAGDGIAGFGLAGVILVSFVCLVLFWVLDSVAKELKPEFSMTAISFIAASFGNLSLATVFLSGGMGLMIVAFYLMPAESMFKGVSRNGLNMKEAAF